MKPIAAIVEQHIDVALLDQQLAVALTGKSDAERTAERHEQLAYSARETAKVRRLEIGRILTKLRGAWPERGPNARPWGELLARHKLAESTARMYMDEFRDPKGFAEKSAKTRGERPTDPGDALPAGEPIGDRDATPANVHGGSGEAKRGAYCTPKKYADAVGPWDLDPFSNPHAHIVAKLTCMLENGGNGLADPSVPGSFRYGPDGLDIARATQDTRTFWQPPYERGFIERVVAHYGHTRFCALLRWAPDTAWFAALWPLVRVVAFPLERIPFETPEGVQLEGADEDEDRGAPYPHAFYYRDERDVTDAIRALCIVLRVDH